MAKPKNKSMGNCTVFNGKQSGITLLSLLMKGCHMIANSWNNRREQVGHFLNTV